MESWTRIQGFPCSQLLGAQGFWTWMRNVEFYCNKVTPNLLITLTSHHIFTILEAGYLKKKKKQKTKFFVNKAFTP